ncbi:hypothetical protein PFLUV_G00259620 [Perca fluviatilis]|uniref:Tight junction-associated protein 1 domain-containing protein n=1 Tax=Perca fluviatilis TaxID=8168 RepID=A0A6A5E4D2_PERFL|nr:hypothetical protein PFLUV_G00259620 [Perca fluviatilis]
MDQEIVELTNKLLDAKNTVDRLEELNERYRQDCNLAVQLLKCNKSHFRNHKFADLPYELQDMLNKHMKSSLPERGGSAPGGGAGSAPGAGGQDPDTLSLTPADVVPTSVIARVLEKPEPLLLNSAQSSSVSRPVAEDVFVHVDMTGGELHGRQNGGRDAAQQNGSCRSQSSLDGNMRRARRRTCSPTGSGCSWRRWRRRHGLRRCTAGVRQPDAGRSCNGGVRPRGGPSSLRAVRGLLSTAGRPRRRSWTPSRGSSLDTDTDTEPRARRGLTGATEKLLMSLEDDDGDGDGATADNRRTQEEEEEDEDEEEEEGEEESSAEERDVLPHELPVISPRLLDLDPALGAAAAAAPPQRPQKSPKRMGVHHLLRKDSLTRAQEQGTLLD